MRQSQTDGRDLVTARLGMQALLPYGKSFQLSDACVNFRQFCFECRVLRMVFSQPFKMAPCILKGFDGQSGLFLARIYVGNFSENAREVAAEFG